MDKKDFFGRARDDLDGPLHGVSVLDTTTAWAGPMVSCVLADLGCDVVHVDLPDAPDFAGPRIGDTGLSFISQTVNRNKLGLGLDLRREESRDVYLSLVETTDIVVENFRPGTLDGWGIGYEHCRAVKEDIVYVSVSGWGQFGPWSDRAGYDPAALAAGGWMSLNGSADGPPVKAPTFLADDLAGLHGALGALAALRHRDQTGEGQHVDVALLDALLFQSNGLLSLGATDQPLERWGSQVNVTHPCDVYDCSDGAVYMAIALDPHWGRLARVMSREDLVDAPGFATNDERIANRDSITEVIARWCATRTTADVLDAVLAEGLVVARVNSFAEAAREAHVLERDMLQDVEFHNGTRGPITGPAAKFSRTPTRVRRAAPAPGADTEEILTRIGLDPDQIVALRAAGIIA
ncbi:MAG: CaiB/BaiF CoA transferase family protein [Acidimicrobiales bacterium]